MSFLRFVAFERRWRRMAVSWGPFELASELTWDTNQPGYYRTILRQHLDWFRAYLPVPSELRRHVGRTSMGVGVCWFKAGARQHICRMQEMCLVLNELGYPIERRWTANPGPLFYQDDFQIVALEYTRPAPRRR